MEAETMLSSVGERGKMTRYPDAVYGYHRDWERTSMGRAMANLGNGWHLPLNSEPPGHEGMRTPVWPTSGSKSLTVWTGNQFAGAGLPGNQLQDGSLVIFRLNSAEWIPVPMEFDVERGNNKYYRGVIPSNGLAEGARIEYYFRLAYDDRDTTYLHGGPEGITYLTSAEETAAQNAPFAVTVDRVATRGQWSDVFALPNVAIHATLLPTGQVLAWGRRDGPTQSLDTDPASPPGSPAATCTPFVWNPQDRSSIATPAPTLADGTTNANLFCSGHTLLPDGCVLVAGGHLSDGAGLRQICVYDPVTGRWTPGREMVHGRWYPTLIALAEGSILIIGGSFRDAGGASFIPNLVPEIWRDGVAAELDADPDGAFDLYPRAHLVSNGLVRTTGSLQQTWSIDPSSGGTCTPAGTGRQRGQRDYAPSVLYDGDRVAYLGGGSAPIGDVEITDLGQSAPQWSFSVPMTFPRRQHNATILADGTVLVTGGTRSGGMGAPQNFNNLDAGQPVHVAELWDPHTKKCTMLAAESVDRCYHATALLLPDGTVLSAGGGEFYPIEGSGVPNAPADSHRDAQVFAPPYLFGGDRPVITAAPDTCQPGSTFSVSTTDAAEISSVTWVGLGSVTHSFNTGQRFASLAFIATADGLDVTAPAAGTMPPGHYLLFLIGSNGVPSVAKIQQFLAPPAALTEDSTLRLTTARAAAARIPTDAVARHARAERNAGTRAILGLTGTCPYGIAACWGGANEALRQLDGVLSVDPIADATNSTGTVYLAVDAIPALTTWQTQFHRLVNDSYQLRGVEITLNGTLEFGDGQPTLHFAGQTLVLTPLAPDHKVQWDRTTGAPAELEPEEVTAYERLTAEQADSVTMFAVTGPIVQVDTDTVLQVRTYQRTDDIRAHGEFGGSS
jgi:galactose oxidase